MVKIICSAIWYKEFTPPPHGPMNTPYGMVVCGRRHSDIIGVVYNLSNKRTVKTDCGEYVQGFVTSDNRFVDRKEAWEIAYKADQIYNPTVFDGQEDLFSENLY